MKIAYFVNQYPAVSHTFIRREIAALESMDVVINRYSLRSKSHELVDSADIAEAKLTHYILETPLTTILIAFIATLLASPFSFIRSVSLATKIGWRSDRGVIRHWAYVLEAVLLADCCKRENINHIHAHFLTNSATVAMLASELAQFTYSFTAHGGSEIDQVPTSAMDEKLKRAKFIVSASWYVRSQLMRRMNHANWEKIRVVHCGLSGDFLEYEAPPYPINPRLLCVGRLCEEKAQLLLIQATKKLKTKGIDFELVLAGDGPLRQDIERAIEDAGLKDQIKITGWISSDRVRQELAAARALVLPSLIEGLPVVIMESMALARPVISTFIAGIPELVIPGETGWLVPPGNVDALSDAIAHVLDMSLADIELVGRAARTRVRERHNILTEASKLKALFESSTKC